MLISITLGISQKIISGYESINSVNFLYFIISGVEGYVEEKNVNKYLTFASTDKKKRSINKIIYGTLGWD